MKQFFVYILRCSDNSFYTGWTVNLKQRLVAHNQGIASKYTRARCPAVLIYLESVFSKSEALKREFAIKQLSSLQKEALVLEHHLITTFLP